MSNSSLASYKRLSPNKTNGRVYKKKKYSICRITPHCIVGQWTVQTAGTYFANPKVQASCNYAIGKDGKIGLIVDESNRAWTSSSGLNDAQAVTIECASDTTTPYAFTNACYNALVDLCVDICKRNGKNRLIWIPDKKEALAYTPHGGEMLLTVHRWFKQKACPGDWLMQRMGNLATEVTNRLNPKPDKKVEDDEVVDKTKVLLNGKEVEVTRIIKDGVNYVKLRDIDSVLGLCSVGYDDKLKMPVIKTK